MHGSPYDVNLQRRQTMTAPSYKVLLLKMHLFMLFSPESSCLNFRMSFQNKADTYTEEYINAFCLHSLFPRAVAQLQTNSPRASNKNPSPN